MNKKAIALVILFFLCCLSTIAYAWVESFNVTVTAIYQWNDPVKDIGIVLSNGERCYFSQAEVRFHSITTALYLTGKSADVHCYENNTKSIGGIDFYKLHRIVAK